MKRQATKKERKRQALEYGVNLDVMGRALIAQADERIKWHQHTAAAMAAELETQTSEPSTPGSVGDAQRRWRRTDLRAKIDDHLEYARFLTFVRDNIVANRRYRLGLTDLSALEITPKY